MWDFFSFVFLCFFIFNDIIIFDVAIGFVIEHPLFFVFYFKEMSIYVLLNINTDHKSVTLKTETLMGYLKKNLKNEISVQQNIKNFCYCKRKKWKVGILLTSIRWTIAYIFTLT